MDVRLHPWLPLTRDPAGGLRPAGSPAALPEPTAQQARTAARAIGHDGRLPGESGGLAALVGAGHVVATADLARSRQLGGTPLERAHLTRAALPGADPRQVWRRADHPVRVDGPDSLVGPTRRALSDCGIRAPSPGGSPDALLVFWGRPAGEAVHDWMAAGRPHLVLAPRADSVRVGPLVLPGRTACLRCLDLARTDADPAWPALQRQLHRTRVAEPDAALSGHATALAVRLLVALIQDDATLADAYWVVHGDRWEPQHRAVARHPQCGCWWPPAPADPGP